MIFAYVLGSQGLGHNNAIFSVHFPSMSFPSYLLGLSVNDIGIPTQKGIIIACTVPIKDKFRTAEKHSIRQGCAFLKPFECMC